jgi:hypothetical protein
MMKSRLALLGLAVLALCNCSNCPDPNSIQAKAENVLADAAYAWANGKLGPLAGPPPARAGGPGDCRCSGGCDDTAPAEDPAALWSPPHGACTATASDGACAACVTAHCCAETLACVAETTCTCLMVKQTPGISWPADAPCGAEDAASSAEIACLSTHCAQECSP